MRSLQNIDVDRLCDTRSSRRKRKKKSVKFKNRSAISEKARTSRPSRRKSKSE